jgi:NAD(P)-dependent dehydrogenase (short-subunit alcohol dehydrogenase family)
MGPQRDARTHASGPGVVRVDLSGARTLVAGATGVLGGALAQALHAEGARLALAGRDSDKLASLGQELDGAPTATFDALALGRCTAGRRELRYDLQKAELTLR